MFATFGSIPSPSSTQLEIGPLALNYYGLCIGIGVLAAVWLGQRRWADRGGDPDDIGRIALYAVPAGLVGARMYHVITDWRPIESWLKVWEGGLGIPGGLIAGIGVGVFVAWRMGLDLGHTADAVIPGIPVAQAIGRLGNWFNQEIFGGPSDLPWAVEIDPEHRPAEFLDEPTFHPAFLYEALWNLGLAGFLIWIDRRGLLRKGMMLPLYVLGYGIGRFLVESIRTDPATLILGIRVNHWVSGLAVVGALVVLAVLARRAEPGWYAVGGDGEQFADAGADSELDLTDSDTDADSAGSEGTDDEPDADPGSDSDDSVNAR